MTAERDKIVMSLQDTSTNCFELVLSLLPSLFQCGHQENIIYMIKLKARRRFSGDTISGNAGNLNSPPYTSPGEGLAKHMNIVVMFSLL